jgi:hypothetical protein
MRGSIFAFTFRTGVTSVVSWLVWFQQSGDGAEVAALSRMEQSVEAGSGPQLGV